MKKLFYVLIAAMATSLLGGCGLGTGSSAPPPPWANTNAPLFNSPDNGATAGDGRVELQWIPTSGVEYWVFAATNSALTAFNWTGLANAQALVAAPTPSYMCGLIDNLPYYFATNGRIDGGPGGASSSTITATPYDASTKWLRNITSFTSPIYGLGYTSLTTCANNTALSATGTFAAVGQGGAIFTSADGISWAQQTTPVGFSANLNAVAGYAANQNNATTPGLRWVAVGNGGASVYSLDGITWTVGNPANSSSSANPGNNTLRSITQVGGTFWAVGDKGTVINSSDGINWNSAWASITTNNLNGISYAGGVYVAVGDSGTIMTNGTLVTPAPTIQKLNQVAAIATAYGSIYVAVGANGTIVTSDSYHGTGAWTAMALPGAPNLVGVTVESRGVETQTAYTNAPLPDSKLGFIASAQFVAIDDAGNAYTSLNGYDWTTTANPTGKIPTGTTSLNAIVSSGFGYIAAGNTTDFPVYAF